MSKRAKYNLACGDKLFEQGKIYEDAEVADLDQSNFEDAEAPADATPAEGTFSEEKKNLDGGQASSVVPNETTASYPNAGNEAPKETLE
jgi:hypothetical protein